MSREKETPKQGERPGGRGGGGPSEVAPAQVSCGLVPVPGQHSPSPGDVHQ